VKPPGCFEKKDSFNRYDARPLCVGGCSDPVSKVVGTWRGVRGSTPLHILDNKENDLSSQAENEDPVINALTHKKSNHAHLARYSLPHN